MSHLLNGRNDEAANAGRRAVHSNPGFSSCHAAALAELGRVDEAESVAAHILVLQPSFSTHGFCAALPFRPRWPIGSQKPGARPVAAIVNRSAAEKGAFQYSAAYERQRYPLGEFPEGKG